MILDAYTRPYEQSDTRKREWLTPAYHRTSRPLSSQFNASYRPSTKTSGTPCKKQSLDFTQRIERKLAEYNTSQNVFKRWLFEISSWLVSACCMGAIIGIDIWVNGAPMSQVNTYLNYTNVLGKVASAALIVPTSEALGQLKWNWFQKSNAMWDFEIFDKASRGALGATLLLFRTKGRSLAALGALIIVLLLAIDTFFQQVVEFPDRWALQNTISAIPRVVKYEPVYIKEFWQEYENNQYNKDLRPVIQEYLYNNGTKPLPFGNGTRPDIPLSCPTSNCTWPAYETFAVCSNCVDVSDSLELTFTCLNTTIDWTVKWTGPLRDVPYPNGTVCGYFLNATSTAPTLISGYTIPDDVANSTAGEALLVRALPLTKFLTRERLYDTGSINFNSIRNPITDFLLASAPNGSISVYREERPIVHECLLSWCVQTMRSSYDYGRYHETIETTHQNNTAGLSPWISFKLPKEDGVGQVTEYMENITIIPPVSRLDHFPLTIANAEYGLNNDTANNVMMIFDDFFPSYYTTLSESAVPQLRHKEYEDGPYRRILPFNPWLAPNNITRHVERLATAMTNVIRSSSSQEMLLGDAYQKENYVKIKWEWLSFPIALPILSLVFLVSTIIKTSRDGEMAVWKTSAMPTLISSLPQDVQKELSPSRIDKSVSRKVRIKLLPDQGWRVSRQLCASPTSDRNGHHGPPAFV